MKQIVALGAIVMLAMVSGRLCYGGHWDGPVFR